MSSQVQSKYLPIHFSWIDKFEDRVPRFQLPKVQRYILSGQSFCKDLELLTFFECLFQCFQASLSFRGSNRQNFCSHLGKIYTVTLSCSCPVRFHNRNLTRLSFFLCFTQSYLGTQVSRAQTYYFEEIHGFTQFTEAVTRAVTYIFYAPHNF